MAKIFSFASEAHPLWTPFSLKIHKTVWDCVGIGKVREIVRQWAIDFSKRQTQANQVQIQRAEQAKRSIEAGHKRLAVAQEVSENWNDLFSLDISEADRFRRCLDIVPKQNVELTRAIDSPEFPLPLLHRTRTESEQWVVLAAIHDYYYPDEKITPWPFEQWNQSVPTDREEAEGGLTYWRLVARVDQLTKEEKPIVENWLAEVGSAIPKDNETLAKMTEVGIIEKTVNDLEAEEEWFDNTGQDEELAAVIAEFKHDAEAILKGIGGVSKPLCIEEIASMIRDAQAFSFDDLPVSKVGKTNRNHFWYLLREADYEPADIRDIWNDVLTKKQRASLGDDKEVSLGTGSNTVRMAINRHRQKLVGHVITA